MNFLFLSFLYLLPFKESLNNKISSKNLTNQEYFNNYKAIKTLKVFCNQYIKIHNSNNKNSLKNELLKYYFTEDFFNLYSTQTHYYTNVFNLQDNDSFSVKELNIELSANNQQEFIITYKGRKKLIAEVVKEKKHYKINGLFIPIKQKVVDKILKKIKIPLNICYNKSIISTPLNINKTLIVIPEIKEKDEEYYIINGRILLVNTKTGKIINSYFKEEAWESDAVFIENIEIGKSKKSFSDKYPSFSICFYKRNMSQPNPYNEILVNEFVINLKTIDNVFNYLVYNYGGETDMKCYADMISETKEIQLLSTKHNGFYDFQLKTSKQDIKYRPKGNDCIEKEGKIVTSYRNYYFDGKQYSRE